MKTLLLLIIMAITPTLSFSKDTNELKKIWQKPFGGSEDDRAYAMV